MADSNYQFLLNEFIEEILTKEDLMFFIEEINSIEKLIFEKPNISISEKLKESMANKNFVEKIKKLEERKIISKDPEENKILFEKLKKDIKNLPQIKIIINFQPRKIFINKVSNWLTKKVGQKLILDFIFNPDVVGGAIIEYQGKQLNLSLAEKIEKLHSV